MNKEERYVSVVSLYVYGKDKHKALEEANQFCKELNQKYDCRASVDELYYTPSGFAGTKIPVEKRGENNTIII